MPVGKSAPVPVAGKNELPVPMKLLDGIPLLNDGNALLIDGNSEAEADADSEAEMEAEAAVGKKDEDEPARRTTSRFLVSSAGAAEANMAVRPRRAVMIAVFIFAGRVDR